MSSLLLFIEQLVGTTVGNGRFRLERQLGEGGMGGVFAAVEVATGDEVAVKVMHPGLGRDPRYLARFRREADVMSRLDHPHVVRAIATGGGEGEPPFIAMELLPGASLSERLATGESFDAARTVVIARQVLAALGAAHQVGVIHRDVKPANVMVLGHEAKLVDFGVARLAMSEEMERLTKTGQVLGTATYMAPEQAMGEPADVTVDVYAVGALMHRLLVGEPPYGSGRYVDIIGRMVSGKRQRVHERIGDLGGLADVIERALEPDPAQRFPTTDAFDAALAPFDVSTAPTIGVWRPPANIEALRVAPEAVDVEVTPAAPAIAPEPVQARSKRLSLVLVAVAFAVVLGFAGTWFAMTPNTQSAVPQSTPAAAIPVVPVTPTEMTEGELASAEDAIESSEDGEAGEPKPARPTGALRTPRTRRVSPVRIRAELMLNGGHRQWRDGTLRTHYDWTSCWPRGMEFPEYNRSIHINADTSADGELSNFTVSGNDNYPVLRGCLVQHLEGASVGPSESGAPSQVRVSFDFRRTGLDTQ